MEKQQSTSKQLDNIESKEDAELQSTKQFSSLIHSGMINIIAQNGRNMPAISEQILYDDIKKMVNDIQNGDTEAETITERTN